LTVLGLFDLRGDGFDSGRRVRHLGVSASEAVQVVGVVRGDDAATEPDGGGDGECVDRQFASGADVSEEVPGDASDPHTGGHDLREASGDEAEVR